MTFIEAFPPAYVPIFTGKLAVFSLVNLPVFPRKCAVFSAVYFLRLNLTFVEKNYLSFLEYMQFVSVWARFPCKFDSFSSFPSEICSSV